MNDNSRKYLNQGTKQNQETNSWHSQILLQKYMKWYLQTGLRITNFVKFNKQQYGLQKHGNTQAAVLDILKFINNSLDDGPYVAAVLIDSTQWIIRF